MYLPLEIVHGDFSCIQTTSNLLIVPDGGPDSDELQNPTSGKNSHPFLSFLFNNRNRLSIEKKISSVATFILSSLLIQVRYLAPFQKNLKSI